MLRLILIIVLAFLASGSLSQPAAAQGGGNRAALIVRNGLGQEQTQCISFPETSISGDELLNRSGLAVIMNYNAGLGGAVCSIGGYGCAYPTQDCFCQCQGQTCQYWAYYHWDRDRAAWAYSQVGATGYQVTNGALEGWSWGPGAYGTVGTLPPMVTFDEICAPPTATPSPTRTATASPTPSRTPTPSATATSAPANNTPLLSLPDVVFESDTGALTPGACTVLRWTAWNAQQVTLDGTAVSAQDRREVCLQASQQFVLAATNAAGTVRREIRLSVNGSQAQPTASVTPSATPQSGASPMPSATLSRNTAAPTPIPPTSGPAAQTGVTEGRPLLAGAQAQAAPMPSATPPAATGVPTRGPTPTAHLLATPPPTRALAQSQAAREGPTPTPILMARVSAHNGPASPGQPSSPVGTSMARPDRSFRMAFLPGYAVYLLMAATLVGMGTLVIRRRQKV